MPTETYTIEDMARAWDMGYLTGANVFEVAFNPYRSPRRLSEQEFALPEDYVHMVKGKVL